MPPHPCRSLPTGGSRPDPWSPVTQQSGSSIAVVRARRGLRHRGSWAWLSQTEACVCCQTAGAASTRACPSGPMLLRSSRVSGARRRRPWARGRSSIAAATRRGRPPPLAAAEGSCLAPAAIWWARCFAGVLIKLATHSTKGKTRPTSSAR